jgi:hypothetical protein
MNSLRDGMREKPMNACGCQHGRQYSESAQSGQGSSRGEEGELQQLLETSRSLKRQVRIDLAINVAVEL